MDLTAGITQMQSQLRPDMFNAYQQGSNAFATAEKNGQEIAANRIKNENAQREQEIQTRLQKAIEESFDPATGQPNYDLMAANGHKYGISAQQMDYAIKHLKENWQAISETAQNKQTTGAIAQPGWNTQPPKAQATEQTQVAPPVAPAPKATEPEPSTSKGVAAPTVVPEVKAAQTAIEATKDGPSENESSINGVPQSVQVARPEIPGEPTPPPPEVDPFAAEPSDAEKAKAQAEFDARMASNQTPSVPAQGTQMDLGQQTITAQAPVATVAPKPAVAAPTGHTLYQNLNDMEVKNPYDLGGVAGQAGGGTGVLTAPRNRTNADGSPIDVTINPQEDIEGNTKSWLRNHSYNSGNYDTDYNQALNDVASASLAKMPLIPMKTGDYKKDMEALNAYRNEAQKVQGEAIQAKLKLRDEIASGNYTAADNTLKTLANTIEVDDKTYRGRDAAARATALSLIPVKSEIPKFKTDLNNINPNDPVGLQMLLARGARLYAGALTPGAQVSEGSLEEVGRQIFGDSGFDWKKMGVQLASAFRTDKWKGVGEVLASYASKVDGGSIKARLGEMADGASHAIDSTLKASLIGYKGSSSDLEKPKGSPEVPPSDTPIVKSGWYDRKPGAKIFKAESGDNYIVTGRDPMGFPNQAKDKEGNVVKIVGDQDGPSSGVSIVPWNQESPSTSTKKGAKAPAKKTETPLERIRRLRGAN